MPGGGATLIKHVIQKYKLNIQYFSCFNPEEQGNILWPPRNIFPPEIC